MCLLLSYWWTSMLNWLRNASSCSGHITWFFANAFFYCCVQLISIRMSHFFHRKRTEHTKNCFVLFFFLHFYVSKKEGKNESNSRAIDSQYEKWKKKKRRSDMTRVVIEIYFICISLKIRWAYKECVCVFFSVSFGCGAC